MPGGYDPNSDGYIYIDAQRHLKSGRSVAEMRRSKGTNMLFCDGSARPVSPEEAWAAIRGNGITSPTP